MQFMFSFDFNRKLIFHINNLFKNLEINTRAPEQGWRRKARVNVPGAVFTKESLLPIPCLMILILGTNLTSYFFFFNVGQATSKAINRKG